MKILILLIATFISTSSFAQIPVECKFSWFSYGDKKGEVLAKQATNECMRNREAERDGRPNDMRYDAQNIYYQQHNAKINSRKQR